MTKSATTRHFLRVGDREIHYRRAGSGPPFILLHSSPQSAAFVLPGLLPLAQDWTLIGLDTPGYGGSDPLPQEAPSAMDYADATVAAMDALGIARAPIYGTHTGAHIALEVGLRHPERVAGLVLDGISFNTAAEAKERLGRYAPEFHPTADGAHLAWAWQHTRDQIVFYPWFRTEKARRLDSAMAPPAYIHDIVLAKMDAAGYWLGYRAAFGHDSRAAMYQLGVKTTVVARVGDVLAPEAKRLTDLPAGVRVLDTGKDGWIEAIRASLAWCAAGDSKTAAAVPPTPRAATWRDYVGIDGGQRLVRRGGMGIGRPVVLLHGDMGSSRTVLPQAEALSRGRPFVALDVAGNAESDSLSAAGDLSAYAADVSAVVAATGFDRYDVYGDSLGAALALALAVHDGERVEKVVLDRPVFAEDAARGELAAHYAPTIEPIWDGTHWLTAWHMLRDRAFFWPWYDRRREAIRWSDPEIDSVQLQQRLLDWLKAPATYGDYVRACLGMDPSIVGQVSQPVLIASVAEDLLDSHAERLAQALSQAVCKKVTGDGTLRQAAMADFLGS